MVTAMMQEMIHFHERMRRLGLTMYKCVMNWLFANTTWIVQTWERHPSMLEMPMVAEYAVVENALKF